MLFFTSGRAPALPRSRDPGTWLAAAQSAAQSVAQSAQSMDPGSMLEQAKSDVADVARHLRTTAPEIADDLVSTPAAIRKSVLAALPTRRRRRSRWPFVVLGGVVAAAVLMLATQLVKRRHAAQSTDLDDRWQPTASGFGSDGLHAPTGMAPDVSPRSDTLERDASLRADDEGMSSPEPTIRGRSLGAAATSASTGDLPYEPSLEDAPDIDAGTL